MTVRVGLIGYGAAGATFHAPLILGVQRLEIVGVATSRALPHALAPATRFNDPQALLVEPSIDLVVIATPNETHFPLAAAALRAGKHVVVDKPVALNPCEADELIRLADEAGRKLTVFHNRRWDGDFQTVQRVIGRLGRVSLFEAHWDRFRPAIKPGWREAPREGSGLLNDLGPHLIDQALQLFGLPEAVTGDLAIQRPEAAVDDYFSVTLHYGRMRAVLSASTLIVNPRPRFALHGRGGSFVKYGLDPQEAALKAGALPLDTGFGEDEPRFHGTFTAPDGSAESIATQHGRYVDFYEAVADAVEADRTMPVDPVDARDGLRIIALARQSAAEGRRLPFA